MIPIVVVTSIASLSSIDTATASWSDVNINLEALNALIMFTTEVLKQLAHLTDASSICAPHFSVPGHAPAHLLRTRQAPAHLNLSRRLILDRQHFLYPLPTQNAGPSMRVVTGNRPLQGDTLTARPRGLKSSKVFPRRLLNAPLKSWALRPLYDPPASHAGPACSSFPQWTVATELAGRSQTSRCAHDLFSPQISLADYILV